MKKRIHPYCEWANLQVLGSLNSADATRLAVCLQGISDTERNFKTQAERLTRHMQLIREVFNKLMM